MDGLAATATPDDCGSIRNLLGALFGGDFNIGLNGKESVPLRRRQRHVQANRPEGENAVVLTRRRVPNRERFDHATTTHEPNSTVHMVEAEGAEIDGSHSRLFQRMTL